MKLKKNILLVKLNECWKNSPYPSVKLTSYFSAYVELFGHLVNKKSVFIETGILDGGSLFMWRDWLGPQARIIGIDLNPESIKWRNFGFEIFIGDQGDPEFWKKTFKQIGDFDALLDDGGHQSFQQIVTAIEAIKFINKNCVVAVEDTATSFMNDFAAHGSYNFLEYAKASTDMLVGRTFDIYRNRFPKKINSESIREFDKVYKTSFYNGIVAFHINKIFSNKPLVVRNMPTTGSSDFRYLGKNFAFVNWPSLLSKKKVVKVYGGKNKLSKFKELLILLIPKNFKILIKKLLYRK